ncbi:MAG: Cysteinyl-tRNA synthetase [Candidatus Fermentimicrarchaeum limneticum]|uniref:Cysteine--tRNA ligase n=1 Tax=Fermentimicrarchaeum limneticum TaxID=2795018 RepID=A0A7D5XCQ4_FERL1|nr:MAG: Cysteinyl-tRNA synthetase [Candidatus Fermentimicrarchaeum limneticum]
MLKVFNTLTRRKEVFRPIKDRLVKLYTCGPSVYSQPHLGNFRTYVFEDVVKRFLVFKGYRVRHIMNITDIEDKAVRAGRGSMKGMVRITRMNEGVFMKNARDLNMLPADEYPRATENIAYMVRMVKMLLKREMAYKDEKGNVFFDVSRFPNYGKLSRSRFRHSLDRRVYKDDYYQREAGDFILWKAWRKSDGDVFWDTELGRGRPGWHIECSAMSWRYLGTPFDMHMGGIDNIFAHHENEIAQTRGATGKMPAHYWLHVRHLIIEGKKMSKSLGNFYTVDDIRRMGYGYDVIRAHLLKEHYRRRLNLTFRSLKRTAAEIRRYKSCAKSLGKSRFWEDAPEADKLCRETLSEFNRYLEDDFRVPEAIEIFCTFVCSVQDLIRKRRFGRRNARNVLETLMRMDSVLGL